MPHSETRIVHNLISPAFSVFVFFFFLLIATVVRAAPGNTEVLKRDFLKNLGIDKVPMHRGPSLPVPDHFWDIYKEDYDIHCIRHYYPRDTMQDNGTMFLVYNLTASGRSSAREHVVKADLKLLLEGANDGQELYIYSQLPEKRLIAVHRVENSTDWIDIDVTDGFVDGQDVQTIFIETSATLKEQPSSMTSLAMGKAVSAPLIVFSDHSEPEHVRRKRSTEKKKLKKKKKQHRMEKASTLCHKAPLYVDFYDLNWQDWIMAPRGYEAGQCTGECPQAMPSHLNATNHAIVQALMHSINPQFVPAPCCVPTETSSLSILLMDVENVITIKEYSDMRVESCGCR